MQGALTPWKMLASSENWLKTNLTAIEATLQLIKFQLQYGEASDFH